MVYKKTGCYDTLCLGFVQIDNQITLGGGFENNSVFGGIQFMITPYVYQVNPFTSESYPL